VFTASQTENKCKVKPNKSPRNKVIVELQKIRQASMALAKHSV